MGAQLHETFLFPRGPLEELIVVLDLYVELLAGVHCELIDHDLPEEAMVDVSLPCRFQPAIPDATTEVAIGDASARVQNQADRDDEDGHEEVQDAHINVPKHTDEPLVHPCVAISRACPLLFCHL